MPANATLTPAAEAAAFPRPLGEYGDAGMQGVLQVLRHRASVEPFNVVATLIFFLAIIHTFLAKRFMLLAHRWREEHEAEIRRRGAGVRAKGQHEVSFKAEIMHFFGEIEAIFGIWVVPLLIAV